MVIQEICADRASPNSPCQRNPRSTSLLIGVEDEMEVPKNRPTTVLSASHALEITRRALSVLVPCSRFVSRLRSGNGILAQV